MLTTQIHLMNSLYGPAGNSAVYLSSAYVRDTDAALVCFAVEANTIYPVFSWRSEGDDYDIFAAAKRAEAYDITYFFLNADNTSASGKNKNLLSDAFSKENLYPVIADPFEPVQGAIIYQQTNNHGQLNFSRLNSWPKMKEKIKRIRVSQPADVMAFLQGLIECRGLVV